MKCPQCGSEMISSNQGWMCLNCGHTEKSTQPTPAKIAPSLSQSRTPQPSTPSVTPVPAPTPPQPLSPPSAPSLPTVAPAPATPQSTPPVPVTPPVTLEGHIGQISVAPMAASLPESPIDKKSRKKALIIAGVALLFLAAGAFAGKLYYLDPAYAPSAYITKIQNAKTGKFSGSASFSSDQGVALLDGKASITGSGSYDVSKPKEAKLAAKFDVKMGQFGIGGEVITLPKDAYVKFSNTSVLQSFGLNIGTDWYKYPLDKDTKVEKCNSQQGSKSGNYLGVSLPKSLPVKNAKRVGLYEQVNGHNTSHLSGEVDFDKLQAVIDDANKQLSADCKIDFKKSDYAGASIKYNLWTSGAFDRLSVHFADTKSKSSFDLTLDSTDYNKPVKIEAPANAKDLSTLIGDYSASTGETTTASTATSSSDSQRKSDLRNVKIALETYYNDNGYYPPENYTNLTKYLSNGKLPYMKTIPTDQQAGKAYEYVPTPAGCGLGRCRAYELRAILENSKDSQITNGKYVVKSAN